MGKYIIHNGNLYGADELYHYGVKGMKWGVRKTPEQLGRKSRSKNQPFIPKTRFDTSEFRKKTTDVALHSRIDKILNWRTADDWNNSKKYASEICRDVVMTRKPADCHEFLSRLSLTLDASVYDDPGVMAVNKQTGAMRYNSCVKFDLNNIYPDSKTGIYDTRDLDRALGHEAGSTYYYKWGELQNRD